GHEKQQEERGEHVGEVEVRAARLHDGDAARGRAEEAADRPIEPLVDDEARRVLVADAPHEEPRLGVPVDVEPLHRAVEEIEDARERVGEGRRRVLHPRGLQHAPAGPRLVAARARPRARPAMARAKTRFSEGCGSRTFCSSAWNMSHSLTKPLSGGNPAIATAPTRKQAAVHGWRLISPPSASMSRVPVPCRTPPAAMKSRLLNAAWFTTW